MSTMLQDVPEVQAAYEAYKRFSADPVMREKIRAAERYEIDKKLDRAYGRAERSVEVARNMKAKGYSVTEIADISGLPLSEVERLD